MWEFDPVSDALPGQGLLPNLAQTFKAAVYS